MKVLDFSKLYGVDFNLYNLVAMPQSWRNDFCTNNVPRRTNALLLFCGCSGEYALPDSSKLSVPKNAVVYIPQGSLYNSEFGEFEGEVCRILIEFELRTTEGEPFVLSDGIKVLEESPNPHLVSLFEDAVKVYTSNVISYAGIKSILYGILSDFCSKSHRQGIRSGSFSCIEKGILYMEKNASHNFTIEEIAEMCHVSSSTFRRLFRRYSGISPVEYRLKSKMEFAKKLLEAGEYNISDVAYKLGYDDVSYFCRVFRKHTGQTPKEYSSDFNRK